MNQSGVTSNESKTKYNSVKFSVQLLGLKDLLVSKRPTVAQVEHPIGSGRLHYAGATVLHSHPMVLASTKIWSLYCNWARILMQKKPKK